MQFFLYLGLGLILVSGICVGAFTTGHQQRGNFYSEQKEERNMKRKVATWTAAGSIGSFALAYLIHLFG